MHLKGSCETSADVSGTLLRLPVKPMVTVSPGAVDSTNGVLGQVG